MTGAVWAINAYNKEKEARVFKGTLLGIVVSFFILILFAFLLNLAESYWYLQTPSVKQAELKNNVISENEGSVDEGFISWHKIFGIKVAHAATFARSDYKASLLIRSAETLELAPGEEATYRVGFKNTGNAPWHFNDRHFVSIYTYGPKYRNSVFQGSGWYKDNQPAKLLNSEVAPGGLGFIEFKIKAGEAEGTFTETFHLAAEDKAWIEGGEFSIPIIVSGTKIASSNPSSNVSLIETRKTETIYNPNYQALVLLKSHEKIDIKAGEVVDMRLGFKNTGKVSWDMRGLIVPNEDLDSLGNSIFFNPTWTSGHQPAIAGSKVAPGQLGFIDFKLKAPQVAGNYTAKFKLVANYDNEVSGGYIEIPVYVTDEGAGALESGQVVNRLNMQEPDLEIGLYYLENNYDYVELTADKSYQLRNKDGATLANLSANESVRIQYNFYSKIFTIKNARLDLNITGELDFKGLENDTVFTILSMSRTTSHGWNDNKYRDEIIIRLSHVGRLWVINKLPMEHYLWGIAETSDLSPLDYIKSIIVASRTYALYHYLNPYKYNGNFTMQATVADQLYRGYNSEIRRDRVKQAVDETKGQVITYDNDIVVTPYFGHSDGRTRSWQEVWGGTNKPWLQSVRVPSDSGQSMFGHGVGMSALGAYHNASSDGWDYTKILKYYYTGVEVSKVY